jgi:AcrR family transcriptional regulator
MPNTRRPSPLDPAARQVSSRLPSERPGPQGGKRDLNRRQRIQALLDGALDRFLSGGLDAVTIDELARAGGIAKGNFYRYFDSKEALVCALYASVNADLQRAFDRCAAALHQANSPELLVIAYATLGEAFTQVVLDSPKLVRLYLQESRGPLTETRAPISATSQLITQRAIELTLIAQSHKLLRDINPTVSALAVIGATERQLQAYLSDELALPAEDVVASLISLVLDGLKGPIVTDAFG